MTVINEECEDVETKHSTLNMTSFNMNVVALQIISVIFEARILLFYETNVGLSIGLIGLGYSIYTIWDAFNEPFSGYLSDHPNRLWKRWGKRFPWIMLSAIPICLSFFLLFSPPDPKVNEWATFFWFLGILCIYDGIFSIWNLNYQSLAPDKYRSPKERTKVSALSIPFHTGGLLIGLVLPPLIIEYDDKSSYLTMSLVVTLLLVIFFVLSIPGIREDEIMRDRAINTCKQEREPFFKNLKSSFKHRNFRLWIIALIASYSWNGLLMTSIPYFVQYVLRLDPEAEIYLYLPYLIFAILSAPLWNKLSIKYGHLKIYKIALLLQPLSLFPLLFVQDLFSSIVIVGAMGFALGGANVGFIPVKSDLMDEAAIIHGERHEGRYSGMSVFFARLGNFIQIVVIVLFHFITNFDPTPGAPQTELALLGIRFHGVLVPVIIMLIQAFIFMKLWTLTPERTKEVKKLMNELNL